jgi:beta-xylosidase
VRTPDGAWYFFTHHGHGAWEGRAASLLPVTWREGWPIIGAVQPDGLGAMVWGGRKPGPRGGLIGASHRDDFDQPALDPRWQWNHQPRDTHWSLTERPGWLRLRAWPPLTPGDFKTAGNTLNQPSFRTPRNQMTLKLDISGMADGQRAGLVHFSSTYATLAIARRDGVNRIERRGDGEPIKGPAVRGDMIWLRSRWGEDGRASFMFSEDGLGFQGLGPDHPMAFGDYRGDRIGIFTFNDRADAGHVDVDQAFYEIADQRG